MVAAFQLLPLSGSSSPHPFMLLKAPYLVQQSSLQLPLSNPCPPPSFLGLLPARLCLLIFLSRSSLCCWMQLRTRGKPERCCGAGWISGGGRQFPGWEQNGQHGLSGSASSCQIPPRKGKRSSILAGHPAEMFLLSKCQSIKKIALCVLSPAV